MRSREGPRNIPKTVNQHHRIEPRQLRNGGRHGQHDEQVELSEWGVIKQKQRGNTANPDNRCPWIHFGQMTDQLDRLFQFGAPLSLESGQIPELPENDQDRDASQESDHDRVRNEASQEAKTEYAQRNLEHAGDQGDHNERIDAIVAADRTDARHGHQGHGAGGVEHHPPRRCENRRNREADHQGVETVNRIDTSQDTCREIARYVGNSARRSS